MTISNITGSPVGGDDFFDRKWEVDALIRSLRAGNSVLLTAPRRVGKSSLMLKALEWAAGQRWLAIHADVQDCDTEASFLEKLIEACRSAGVKLPLLDTLAQKARNLKRFLSGTKLGGGGVQVEVGGDGPEDWHEAGRLFEKLLAQLVEGETRVLLGMDELPIFLSKLQHLPEGNARVDLVLRWLRALRHASPPMPRDGATQPSDSQRRVAWLICGSVGLDTFVEQKGLAGTINDLQLQRLGPFTDETALEFLIALGKSPRNPLEISQDVSNAVLERVGWPLPYYLQMMFHALRELPPHARSDTYPSIQDVDAAYQDLLDPHSSTYFAHWDTRLDDQLDVAEAATARFLLGHICKSKRGMGRERLLRLVLARRPDADPEAVERELRFTLDLLERDGYLHRRKSMYAFRSFLLRDYWKRRFG